jgi:very-short-patch-repair endonuclease
VRKRDFGASRAQQLDGHKFRRQVAMGPYVVDFVCLNENLVIELDGPQHEEGEAPNHDARRTAWLEARGYRVMRFRNQHIDDDVRAVVEEIRQALIKADTSVPPSPLPNPPLRGEGAGEPLMT